MITSRSGHAALPGPRAIPLLGARGNFIAFLRNPISYMSRLHETYGKIVSIARGTSEYVFLFAPEYNRLVLSNTSLFFNLDLTYSHLRVPVNSSLSNLFVGLIQMNGTHHKRHRQLLMPAFQKDHVKTYADNIIKVENQKLAGWRVGQQRDLFKDMREMSLLIAVKTFLGLDPDQGGDAMRQLLDRWLSLVFSLPSVLFPFDFPGLPFHRLMSVSDKLERSIRAVIERRRANDSGEGDVLSMLMRATDKDYNRLTDDELVGHINFLFFAGHTTTASALTWTLFLLDQHPAIMGDLLDELEGALKGDKATEEKLEHLPLLQAVIMESMRLLPPVLWSSRVCTEAVPLGQYELPRGTQVIHSAYITHRLPDYFPQPNKFLPQRWLAAATRPYEYIPFSAGPRTCIGYGLAIMEMKLVLATLLQRFRITLCPGIRLDVGGIMLSSPKQALMVQINPQDRRITKSEVRGNIRRVVDLN
jgi:cytochrome P450